MNSTEFDPTKPLHDPEDPFFDQFRETETPATALPDGWKWIDNQDGSGHLQAPENSYFSYDRQPYSFTGGIEYQEAPGTSWTVFWGDMEKFRAYAESQVREKYLEKGNEKGSVTDAISRIRNERQNDTARLSGEILAPDR